MRRNRLPSPCLALLCCPHVLSLSVPAFRSPLALALGATALGVAHVFSFAPWHLWGLQPLTLAALFALSLHAPTVRATALMGFAFGMGWFGAGVWWVYISMHTYGDMPAPLAAMATLAFCAWLALFPALALGVAARWRGHRATSLMLVLPACWTLSEWLRGVVFTGFPWLASGYAHTDGPLAGYAPVLGMYGICLMAALVAAAAVLVTTHRIIAVAVLLTVPTLGAALRMVPWSSAHGAPLAVRLVQGNVAQDLKFGPEGLLQGHPLHMTLLNTPGRADLAVLPESVFPIPINDVPQNVVQDLVNFVERTQTTLMFGAFIEEPRYHFSNSVVVLHPDRRSEDYRKRHLVPFGEFIPPGFRWFVDLMRMPIGDQERGAPDQAPIALKDQRVALNICYEDLFGAEIITAWHDPSRAPTFLLNLSNLAWFDDSIALDQHLQISRMRALETARPMLRATNTGATALIDERGQVLAALPYLTRDVLDVTVQGQIGTTPYVRWGNGVALGLAATLLLWGVMGASARAPRRRAP